MAACMGQYFLGSAAANSGASAAGSAIGWICIRAKLRYTKRRGRPKCVVRRLTILWAIRQWGHWNSAVLEKGEPGLKVALDVVLVGDGTAEIAHGTPLRVRRPAGTAG